MKKLFLLAVGLLMFCSSVDAQDIMNLRMNRDELGLRGDVTAVDEDNLYKKEYFRDDWPSRRWFRTDLRQFLQEESGHIYTFTPQGNLEQVTYTRRGNKVAGTKVSYAKNGLLTSFLGEGYKIEGKYKGNRGDFNVYAEERTYSNGIDLGTADLATTGYTTSYPFAFTCRQQLSDDGLVLRSNYYYVDSMPARAVQYTYSALGRIAVMRTTFYDRNGRDASVTTTSYTYDGRGHLVRKSVRNSGGNDLYTYQNNALGDCIEMQAEHPYGTSTYTYEYEYDDYGNWVLRLTFKDGEFEYATLRNITYGKNAKNVSAAEVAAATAPVAAAVDSDKASHKADKAKKKDKAKKEKTAKKAGNAKSKPVAKADDNKKAAAQQPMTRKEKRKAQKAAEKEFKKEVKEKRADIELASSLTAKEIAKAQKKADKEAAKAAKKAEKQAAKQAAKEAKKAEKQALKEAKKAEKKAAKEAEKTFKKEVKEERANIEKNAATTAKTMAKEQKKADKEAEKAAKAAAKEAEKQAAKAAKQAEKEAVKAAKEAEKQAKKAAK